MVTQNSNPFVLPGFGQSGDMAQNPLMASMEMMRQAWQGLANSGGLSQAAIAAPMSTEDLERRISDLRAVENWLRMNLSMLSSTIQGLEVQRSTIATLKTFISSAAAPAGSTSNGASPLEVALGMAPGQAPGGEAAPATSQPGTAEQAATAGEAYAATAATAAQGWWDMLQKQFDNLATATAATLQGAEAAQAVVQPGASGVSADSTLGKARAQAPRKAAAKKAAPAKAAVKKAATKAAAPRKQATATRKKP